MRNTHHHHFNYPDDDHFATDDHDHGGNHHHHGDDGSTLDHNFDRGHNNNGDPDHKHLYWDDNNDGPYDPLNYGPADHDHVAKDGPR